MSAEFNTQIRVKGTRENCEKILVCLRTYTEDRYVQYQIDKNCWYLEGDLSEDDDEYIVSKKNKCEMELEFGGPYGVWNGPIGDEIDLFERIADVAPNCWLFGSISGWDSGADQSLEAELKDGLLYLRDSYEEFGCDDEDDEHDEDDETSDDWNKIYDPKSREYKDISIAQEGDSVTVKFSFWKSLSEPYELCLQSDAIEHPINLACFPDDFLTARNIKEIFGIICSSIEGHGAEKKKPIINEFADNMINVFGEDLPTKMELVKIHDHKAPLFFGWMRASFIDPELKKLAKKVCTCAARNKANNLSAFEEYLNTYEPWFPWCEFTGWPDFCLTKWIDLGNGTRRGSGNPNRRLVTRFDWHGVASNLEEFAHVLCSKEQPKDYAEERIVIDFVEGTIGHTGFYMPGGPESKPSEDIASNKVSQEVNQICAGLQFSITGKLKEFTNRDELVSYIEKCGGRVSSSISKKTNYLVNNDSASTSAKNIKAKELGIEIINEAQFIERFGISIR